MSHNSKALPGMLAGDLIYYLDADHPDILKRRFLEALRKNVTVEKAAKFAGVARQHVYHWRKINPGFHREMQMIQDRNHVDQLVDSIKED